MFYQVFLFARIRVFYLANVRLEAIIFWVFVILPFAILPQNAIAGVFKSSEFLTWKRNSQDFYIRTSIGMAGLIATRNDKAHGKCLDDWYFSDEDAANEAILDVMREHPDYHPRGVILAVLEKRCGSFTYSAR